MNKQSAAVEAIKNSDRVYITPAMAAPCLGMAPYALNLIYRDDPARLPFQCIMSGRRLKIPRKAFLRFLGEEVPEC